MTTSVQTTESVEPAEQAPADPATPETPADDQSTAPAGDGLESLDDSWQREIRNLRKENAERRVTSNALTEQLEAAKAQLDGAKSKEDFDKAIADHQARVAELERTVAVQTHTKGLPDDALDLVTGTTDEEIKASADKVRKLLEGAGTREREPDLDASGGLDPRGRESSGQSPRDLARAALSQGRRR